jgi:hypothetical protein
MVMRLNACLVFLLLLGVTTISAKVQENEALPDLAQLEKMASRFAPTPLRVDTSRLSCALFQVAEGHYAVGQGAAALFLDQ